jgi:RNA polymerase sigma-70 factor (ECF subfamily)
MKRRRSIFAPEHELSLETWVHQTTADGDFWNRQIPSQDELPDTKLYREEMNRTLTRGIQALPPNYRTVILLRDMEELSTEDTADILGVSADVVKQRLHRARLALRRLIERVSSPRSSRGTNAEL